VKKKYSVLVIGNFLSRRSFSRNFCEDLTDRLSEAGWKVISTSDKTSRLLRLVDILFTIFSKRNQYKIAQVDVYSGLSFILQEMTCWALRVVRKPYILTLHGGNLPAFAKRWPGRVQRLLTSAAVVTTPSRYLYEQMLPYAANLLVIPNPLSLDAYSFRKRNEPRPICVWLRSFHKIYNPALGIKVVALLASEFPALTLTMIGPDKGDGSLQEAGKLAAQLSVSEKVGFPGLVLKQDVPHWLERGDVFINTTNIDNTPVSVMEAMASGLCIVSTNVGGIPYLLDHEQDALLVPPDDPQAMASAIRRILTENGLAVRLSMNARKKVQQFDWSILLPQWEKLFHDVAGF
jgi:glycosyltransferase involved in cell wall biosynthesis